MTVHEAPVGATVEWYTPPSLFRDLGMAFDLDPASPGADVVPWVPARHHYTAKDNGLIQPWYGRVWLNPPYGQPGVAFIQRMIEHGNGVMLLPARTETRIFQQSAESATAVCFLRERLHFIRADGRQSRASFASVLFAYGPNALPDLGWRTFPPQPAYIQWYDVSAPAPVNVPLVLGRNTP